MKPNPICSLFKTMVNSLRGRIHFPQEYNGTTVRMKDEQEFEIFRHVIIDSKASIPEGAAIFVVRFKLSNMSIEKNKRFSRLPIPMFIGLPGFRAKFWMCNAVTGVNQGVYQWDTRADAEAYSKSFAMKFMTKRSVPNSASFEILENRNIYTFLESIAVS